MLNAKKKKAVELLFDTKLSQKDVADEVGIHESTLSKWKHDDDFNKYMEEFAHKTISISTTKALGTMIGLLDARSELVRFNAAKDLLDRAGFAPTDKVDLTSSDIKITIGGDDDVNSD